MDRKIITQTEYDEVQFALAELGANLNAHVNDSLTKAHGIQVVAGYVDSNGNDLTTYQDSNGEVVGTYFVRFNYNSVAYYAPANATSLSGQPATTGQVDVDDAAAAIAGIGASAWVTDTNQPLAAEAYAIRDVVLLPHTRLGHWETHGGFVVLPGDGVNNVDSRDHIVGRYMAVVNYAGRSYYLPCDTRLGGPPQPPRIGTIPTAKNVTIPEEASNDCYIPLTLSSVAGTAPFTYQWQYYNTATLLWTNITPGAGTQALSIPTWDSGIGFNWASTAVGTFIIVSANPGSDKTRSVQLRVQVGNVDYPTGVISNTCTFKATDKTGCWICTEISKHDDLTENDWRSLASFRRYALRRNSAGARFYLNDCNYLTHLMTAAGVRWELWVGFDRALLTLIEANQHEAAYVLYRDTILKAVARYWPDCQHAAYVAAVEEQRAERLRTVQHELATPTTPQIPPCSPESALASAP